MSRNKTRGTSLHPLHRRHLPPGRICQPRSNGSLLLLFAGSPSYDAPATSAFKDIKAGDQFYKEVSWLASTKISTGWSDATFRAADPVQRAAMAAFIHRYDSSVKPIA